MAGASAAAAALLGAVFLLVSLVVPRALLAGMIYIFAWESLLGRFLPGVRAISSREYALRVFDGILDDDFPTAVERGADDAGRCRSLPAARRLAAAEYPDRLSRRPEVDKHDEDDRTYRAD